MEGRRRRATHHTHTHKKESNVSAAPGMDSLGGASPG